MGLNGGDVDDRTAADLQHRAVGGHEAAAERRRRQGVDPVRQRDAA